MHGKHNILLFQELDQICLWTKSKHFFTIVEERKIYFL